MFPENLPLLGGLFPQSQTQNVDLTSYLDPRHYYDNSLPDPSRALTTDSHVQDVLGGLAGGFANSPFAQDVMGAVKPTLSSIGSGINNAGMYMGLPDTLGEHQMLPPSMAGRMTPGVEQRAQTAPMQSPLAGMFGGPAQIHKFSGPGLPAYEAGPTTDFSEAQTELDLAKPTQDKGLTDDDKLLYILGGLADSGAIDSKNVGDLLFALGTGSIRGMGAFAKDKRTEEDANSREDRAYHGDKANVLASMAQASSGERRENFRGQNDYNMKAFDLAQPKVSGNTVVTTDVGKDKTTYNIQQLPDQQLQQAMTMMALAGNQPVSPSAAIFGGESLGGTPEEEMQLRTFIGDLRMQVAQDKSFQDAIMQAKINNVGGADKVNYEQMLDMYTDMALQKLDPQQYSALTAALSQRQTLRGLSGMFTKPRMPQ